MTNKRNITLTLRDPEEVVVFPLTNLVTSTSGVVWVDPEGPQHFVPWWRVVRSVTE